MSHGNKARKYRPKCRACKKARLEAEFKIFDVHTESYFCNQKEMDKFYGTERKRK